jgi:hypothetical protein
MTEALMPDQLFPEPVPTISQLAVLPFLSAVDGFLRGGGDIPRLRLTMHRAMSRVDQGYLQQVCAYVGSHDPDWRNRIGRVFPVTQGIMGAAFKENKIWRTKAYPDLPSLMSDLEKDAHDNGEPFDPIRAATSFLAIPFLSPSSQAVLIFYADCQAFNFFADDSRVHQVRAMCEGFCRLFDWLQEEPFPSIRNFPFQMSVPFRATETVYRRVQEAWTQEPAPHFAKVYSFNFEGSNGSAYP